MLSFNLPLFNETDYMPYKVNDRSSGCILSNVCRDTFARYCKELENRGFTKREETDRPLSSYAAFQLNDCGIFINFYENLKEININIEQGCTYFDFTDTPSEKFSLSPQITQIDLDDSGMSYAIRLTDGRFIVFDGGWDFPCDADSLLSVLKESSPHKKPIVAAWFLTHPDCDHFQCLVGILNRCPDAIEIQRILYNFPEADDPRYTVRFNDVARRPAGYLSDREYIHQLNAHIKNYHIPVTVPHAGQTYRIGDAVCEILSSIDDVVDRAEGYNCMSLVIRMELAGQIILWTGDAEFDPAHLLARYGDYLKADILQVPHHGFSSQNDKTQIDTYKVIAPKVCFLPVSDYYAFTAIDSFLPNTKFLFTRLGVDEVIPSDPQRTITLPYTAPAYAKKELENRYLTGLDQNGSKTWIFTGLNTANKEDFNFALLNTAWSTKVYIELFFENGASYIGYVKADVPGFCIKNICIIDTNDVCADYKYLNRDSLIDKGIPENKPFAVRFISDEPLVITNKNHKATYFSPNR